MSCLEGHPILIQLDNATVVAYIYHEGRNQKSFTARDLERILSLREIHILALSDIICQAVGY